MLNILVSDIPVLIGESMGNHKVIENPSLSDIIETDKEIKEKPPEKSERFLV